MNSVFLWISSVQNCGNSGNEVLQKYKNLIGDQYIPAPSAVSGGAAGSVGGRYLTVPLDGGHEKQYGNSLAATPSSDELNHRKAGKRHFEGVVGQSNETTQDRREGGKKHGGANDTFMESDYNQSYLMAETMTKKTSLESNTLLRVIVSMRWFLPHIGNIFQRNSLRLHRVQARSIAPSSATSTSRIVRHKLVSLRVIERLLRHTGREHAHQR